MTVLSWLIIGLIAGWLTGLLRGGSGLGSVGDIAIGISGAILGGFIVSWLVDTPHVVKGLDMDNLFGALSGGIVTVILVGTLPGRSEE
jgi:uncharacterized membrane protein YeaQ/YmgE (transglycosylase-associated protein family)